MQLTDRLRTNCLVTESFRELALIERNSQQESKPVSNRPSPSSGVLLGGGVWAKGLDLGAAERSVTRDES